MFQILPQQKKTQPAAILSPKPSLLIEMMQGRKQSKSPCLKDEDLDRISDLPGSIINQILAKLSLREAVRTCVLSSKWRNKWTTLQDLVIDTQCVSTASQVPSVLLGIIDHILLLHSGPIKYFELTHHDLICTSTTHIDRWILHLTRRSIEELVLDVEKGQHYTIPWRLFSCQSLHHLELYNCWLKPPPTIEGLRNLRCLELDRVTITAQDAFENMICSCPLLEKIVLLNINGSITKFNINAPNLKHFQLVGIFDDISFENTFHLAEVHICLDLNSYSNESRLPGWFSNLVKFFVHLSHTKYLRIDGYFLKYLAAGVVPVKLPSSCINLRSLHLEIDFTDLKDISATLCVFRSAPSLQKLEIVAYSGEPTFASYRLDDIFMDWPTMQVRHVSIEGISGVKSEVDFIKFVLLFSPMLQRMTVQPVSNIGLELTRELLKFKRASREAEVIYLDPE